jgi:hypothetical protein
MIISSAGSYLGGMGPLASAPRAPAPVVEESRYPLPWRVEPSPRTEPLMWNYGNLGKDFESFAERLDDVLERMKLLRPDITEGSYDLIHDQGRLKVVDAKLDDRSVIWLEESFNGDKLLVERAAAFNDRVVKTFDTERGRMDEEGVFRRIGDGYGDNGWSRDYSGLEATVGRTTRFMSLQRDIDSHRLRPELGEHNRFDRTGIYMEKYIEKDIIQYKSTSSGGLEVVRSIEGASMFGWLDLVG